MGDHRVCSAALKSDEAVLNYILRLHAPPDEELERVYFAYRALGSSPIQLRPLEAGFVAFVLRLLRPTRVVEIGTFLGYSAIHIARAIQPDGHLWSFEVNPEYAAAARLHISNAGLNEAVTVVEGVALVTLRTIESHGPFDAIFVDADKGSYDRYGEWAARHLRRGGLLLADNVFYFGRLLDDETTAEALTVNDSVIGRRQVIAQAAAMRRFHEGVHEAFDAACLPVPDGFLLGIRK